MRQYRSLIVIVLLLVLGRAQAQEETPFIAYDVPAQNLLKFNRFLLNPTFSTVREDKSYINLFHRNQSVQFNDNSQTYFLSYSGRIGDRSGLGLSLYTQREGLIDNFGVLANYAYGIKLSDKSNFTFGANFSYYNSGFNEGRANPIEDDPLLNSLGNSSLITFQPGFNISYGKLDFGVLADNLFDYNLKTSESITDFAEKTYTGHLQYTHEFKNSTGVLENGRLMPLARVRSLQGEDISLGGSLILDLPKIGWLQAGYDDFYGAAAGVGFNLNQRLSLGYTMEKGLSNTFENFGVNHEISLAYSFQPNLTEDRVLLENDDELASNDDEDVALEELSLSEKDLKIAELEQKLAENDAILDELLMRQDSLERSRESDLERRFNMVMKMVRRETNGERPELEERAQRMYLSGADNAVANTPPNSTLVDQSLATTEQAKRLANLADDSPAVVEADNRPNYTERDKTASSTSTKRFKDFTIPNVQTGHYLIANVYKGERYMHEFIQDLRDQGLEADYFTNPKNGMNYVYLKSFESQREAINAYRSNLDGQYPGETWVMNVKGAEDYGNIAQNTNGYDYSTPESKTTQNGIGRPSQPSMKTYSIDGIGSGFYIIANVFANPNNANRFVKQLNDQGLEAGYFINPENNYRYVFLKKHEEWSNALVSYYSNLNDAYYDPIWIMRVKPNQIT